MSICRLRYETLRSLSRVTHCRHPEALRRDSFARNSRQLVTLTTSRELRELTGIEPKRQRLTDTKVVARHASTQAPRQEEESPETYARINDDLPSLEELRAVEAELLKRLESELRQAADEGDLELKDMLDDSYDLKIQTQPVHEQKATHADLLKALLSPSLLDTPEQASEALFLSLADQCGAEHVLDLFSRALQVPGYMDRLESEQLHEILVCIAPKRVLKPYITLHRNLHPASIEYYGLKQIEDIFAAYYELMEHLLAHAAESLRRGRGWMLAELMEICGTCGMAKRARMILAESQSLPGHVVSLRTYNDYLRAICWDDAFGGEERFDLRVTSHTIALRDSKRGTRVTGFRTGEDGLKDEVLTTIDTMKKSGLVPDAESYSNLIIALGREGLMGDVKLLLKQVWDVDCDKLMGDENMDLLLDNTMLETSPHYPDSNVLAAVAHVFSINNDIASAMRTVDLFSLKYHIAIPHDVWVDILEGTHALAARRWGRSPTQEQKAGRLPLRAVDSLWEIMKSPPYGIPLSMYILRFLLASCIRRDVRNEMIHLMIAGDGFARKSREAQSKANEERTAKHALGDTIGHERVLEDIRDVHAAHDHNIMVDALKHLLGGGQTRRMLRAPPQPKHEWFYKIIPDMLSRFSAYRVPIGNVYDTPTGRIQFHPAETTKRKLKVRSKKPRSEGFLVVQSEPPGYIRVHVTISRQVRLQERYQKRGHLHNIPKWTPRWHETSEVRNMGRKGIFQPKVKSVPTPDEM